MRGPNHVSENSVRAGRGFGGSTVRTKSRQYWDLSLTGEKVEQGETHALQSGLQGMGDGGGNQAPVKDYHRF